MSSSVALSLSFAAVGSLAAELSPPSGRGSRQGAGEAEEALTGLRSKFPRFHTTDNTCVRLVVEVDGTAHHGQELNDARRTADLELLGYIVMRLSAAEVMRSPTAAARKVAAEVERIRGA